MPAMLRHKPTGELYVFTEIMAKRNDMEFVDVPDIAPDAQQRNQAVKKREKRTVEDTVNAIFGDSQ